MKLRNLLPVVATIIMGSIFFSSCGKDDDNPIVTSEQLILNKQNAGSYTGWTRVISGLFPTGKKYDGASFALTLADDGSLTAVFQDRVWGKATFNGVNSRVKASDGNYSLLEAEGKIVITNPNPQGGGELSNEYDCKLEGATINKETKQIEVTMSFVMTGTPHGETVLIFTSGEMPTE